MTDEPNSDHRIVATILAVAAVGCLTYGAASRRWLYNRSTRVLVTEVAIGPRGIVICIPDTDDCRELSTGELVDEFGEQVAHARHLAESLPPTTPNDTVRMAQKSAVETADQLRASGAFPIFGWIAFIACIVAAVSLAIVAALSIARRRVLWPIMPTTTALLGLMIGVVTGCVFVAIKPGAGGFVGVSYGFWVFGAGCVLGLAAAILLNKVIRPLDPDLLDDAMDPEQF
jgi:hypothetical protein